MAEKKEKKEPGLKAKNKKINWNKIKHEYVTGDITYRELSEKYDVSIESIKKEARKTSKRKGWVTLKGEYRNKVYTNAEQETAKKQGKELASYSEKVKRHAERLVDKVGAAINELCDYIVESETTEKVTEFDHNCQKPKKETVTKTKDIEIVCGKINTKSLKELAEALIKLKDIVDVGSGDASESGIIELPAMVKPQPPTDEESTTESEAAESG